MLKSRVLRTYIAKKTSKQCQHDRKANISFIEKMKRSLKLFVNSISMVNNY